MSALVILLAEIAEPKAPSILSIPSTGFRSECLRTIHYNQIVVVSVVF